MKFSDFLKDIVKKGNIDITNPDIAATLGASGLKEIEVPEVLVSQFYEKFYTEDAAMNDPKLKKHFEKQAIGEAFTITDTSVNQVLRDLGYGDEFIKELNKKSWDEGRERIDTKAKLKNFGEEVKKVLSEAKKTEKPKVNDEAVTKMQEDLNNQIKALKEAHEKELKDIQEKARLDKITGALKSKIFSFPLLDMTEEDKLDLANAKINKLLNSYALVENENMGLDIRSKEDPRMEVYDAQRNKLTIDNLLAVELRSFTKKSDVKPTGSDNPSPFTIPDKPAQKMTLAEQNRLRIEEQAKKLYGQAV